MTTVSFLTGAARPDVDHAASKAITLVSTWVMLRSGALVTVSVEPAGTGRHLVTDLGLGHKEALLLGAEASYVRHARKVAETFGIGFDDGTLFARDVTREQLKGAVACVANAAQRSVDLALEAGSFRAGKSRLQRLTKRLTRLFADARIEPEVETVGASGHVWRVDARVTRDRHQYVLELLTAHHGSVAAATTKFHDLARLADAPTRIAVVPSKKALGTWLGVIAQAASVVEDDAPDRTWERALAA